MNPTASNIDTYNIVVKGTLNYDVTTEFSTNFIIKNLDCSDSTLTASSPTTTAYTYTVKQDNPLTISYGLFSTSLLPCTISYSVIGATTSG